MKLQLTINALATAATFGMWQNDVLAGVFIFVLLGFVLSTVDYVILKYRGGVEDE
jgi:hypothetical protein